MRPIQTLLVAVTALFLSGTSPPARADEAFGSNKPVEWDYIEGTTVNELNKILHDRDMRIVDFNYIGIDNVSAVIIKNEGAYKMKSWWYYGLTEAQVWAKTKENKARLETVDADYVNGTNYFNVLMVENPDDVKWAWYFNNTGAQLAQTLHDSNMRMIYSGRYWWNSSAHNAVMISNTGKNKLDSWYYYNVSPSEIDGYVAKYKARVYSIRPYDSSGHYDVVLVPAGDTTWGWAHGESSNYSINYAKNNNMRIVSGAFTTGWTFLGDGKTPKCGAGAPCCPGNLCDGRAVCASSATYGDEYGFGGGGTCKNPPSGGIGSGGSGGHGGGGSGGHGGGGSSGHGGGGSSGSGGGCGAQGQLCCASGQCHEGNACDGTHCHATSTANCGVIGAKCCPPSSAGSTCNPGGQCLGNTCQPCGAKGQPCCSGTNTSTPGCNLGLTCGGALCQ